MNGLEWRGSVGGGNLKLDEVNSVEFLLQGESWLHSGWLEGFEREKWLAVVVEGSYDFYQLEGVSVI